MLSITKLCQQVSPLKPLFPPIIITAHMKTCPTINKATKCPPREKMPEGTSKNNLPSQGSVKGPVCPGSGGGGDGGGGGKEILKRELKSGKVRLGLIPEEWFLFFHSKTGVTGPYLFGIMLTNYLVSKEKFVMEHEYYIGLSMFVMTYYASKNFGQALGAVLDKEVDEIAGSYEKIRKDEISGYEDIIKQAKDAQWRAKGQNLLMNAKKENIAMQLEAVYRERLMQVYKIVKGRMDYHVKLYRAESRIQQKWMLEWILSHVMKSITPELEQQALSRAIEDLAAAAAGQAK